MLYGSQEKFIPQFNLAAALSLPSYFATDVALHKILRNQSSTLHFHSFLNELLFRNQHGFIHIAHPEQVMSFAQSMLHAQSRFQEEFLRRDEMEHILQSVCKRLAHIAVYKPRYTIQEIRRDETQQMNVTRECIAEMMHANMELSAEFAKADRSYRQLETRKIIGILDRTNYFLEYKKFQLEHLGERMGNGQ